MNDWRVYTDLTGESNHQPWHEVLKAIATLDGRMLTVVHAAYGDHVDLVVSGGNNGKVLVQWKEYDPEEKHFVLINQEPANLFETLVVEGQEMTIPKAWCISLEQAVPVCGDILRTCEKGQPAGLDWLEIRV